MKMHTIQTVLLLLSLSYIVLALAPVVTNLPINKTLISHDFPGPENEIFQVFHDPYKPPIQLQCTLFLP